MINPAAYFDVLSLGERIGRVIEGFSRQEAHLLGYAACLLSLYEGSPVADWGYEFVATGYGLPFSEEMNASIEIALSLQHVRVEGSLLVLTDDGLVEAANLRSLQANKARDRYLEGAADCLLVFNPGNVREAFNYDPTISFLRSGNRTEWLLTAPVVERLYANFQQLRLALDYDPRDLSVPMVGWLKYLIQTGRNNSYGDTKN
jgi:hypothetical protein